MRIVLSLLIAFTLSIGFAAITPSAQAAGKADLVNGIVDGWGGF